jgi:hypothetical protein
MKLSSLRALMLALAMVLQTIAGAAGVARAASAEAGAALLAHCASVVQDDKATDGRQGEAHRHCDSCCLCAAISTPYVPEAGTVLIAPNDAHRIVSFTPDRARLVFTASSQSPPARGPPAGAAAR